MISIRMAAHNGTFLMNYEFLIFRMRKQHEKKNITHTKIRNYKSCIRIPKNDNDNGCEHNFLNLTPWRKENRQIFLNGATEIVPCILPPYLIFNQKKKKKTITTTTITTTTKIRYLYLSDRRFIRSKL